MDLANVIINVGVFIATAGAAAVAWWQALEASKSRDDARESERAALEAQQNASESLRRANEISAVALRGPYAYALIAMTSEVISARIVAGADEMATFEIVNNKAHELTEKSFAAGDVPTFEFNRWVTTYARKVDLGTPFDLEKWSTALEVINERVRLWMRDPVAATELVTRDPIVPMTFGRND